MNDSPDPKVSIIIPTYNQEKVVSNAIESAINQTYPNIEIIISDDCSTDGTSEIVKKYLSNNKIKYFRNSTNLGRVKNYRKTLYERTTGDWVLNLDGDDRYENNHVISDLINMIFKYSNQNIYFIQGGRIKIKKNGHHIYEFPPIKEKELLLTGREYFLNYSKTQYFSHISTIYKRDVALKNNFYHKNIISSDVESFLKLAIYGKGKILYIKKLIGIWIEHDNNESSKINFNIRLKNLLYLEEIAKTSLKNHIINKSQLKKWILGLRVNFFLDWISKILLNGRYNGMVNYFILLLFIIRFDYNIIFKYKFIKNNFKFIIKHMLLIQ